MDPPLKSSDNRRLRVGVFVWASSFPPAAGAAFRVGDALEHLSALADVRVFYLPPSTRPTDARFLDTFSRHPVVVLEPLEHSVPRLLGHVALKLITPHAASTARAVLKSWSNLEPQLHDLDLLVVDRPYWLSSRLAEQVTPIVLLQCDAEHSYWAEYRRQVKGFPGRLKAAGLQILAVSEMKRAYHTSTLVVSISPSDAMSVAAFTKGTAKVDVVPPSIDSDHWLPAQGPSLRRRLVFLGTDEPRNVAALRHMSDEILPLLGCELTVVGSFGPEVQGAFSQTIKFTGAVEDVRDYLEPGDVMIAPYATNTGLKLKILHAMASGVPCIISPAIANSLPPMDGSLVAETPAEYVEAFISLTDEHSYSTARLASARSARRYFGTTVVRADWTRVLATFG